MLPLDESPPSPQAEVPTMDQQPNEGAAKSATSQCQTQPVQVRPTVSSNLSTKTDLSMRLSGNATVSSQNLQKSLQSALQQAVQLECQLRDQIGYQLAANPSSSLFHKDKAEGPSHGQADASAGVNIQSQQQQDEELRCEVCTNAADGFHFGALSCAACSAFFRRSISEHKRYICLSKECDVTKPLFIEARKHGIVCRFCRFQKCIAVGMKPEEVQPKRGKKRRQRSEATHGNTWVTIPKAELSRCASSSTLPTHSKTMMAENQPRKKSEAMMKSDSRSSQWHVPTLAQQPSERDGQRGAALLAAIGQTRRRMEIMRGKGRGLRQIEFPALRVLFEHEMLIFEECLRGEPMLSGFQNCAASNLPEAFLSCFLLETALTSLALGGIQTNRVYFPNQGFVEVHTEALVNFYAPQFARDARTLARLSMPIGRFFLESLCRSLQQHHFGEKEVNALFAMAIFGITARTVSDEKEITQQREQMKRLVFEELARPTAGNSKVFEAALRMGNLVLVRTALEQLSAMLREHFCAIQLCQ